MPSFEPGDVIKVPLRLPHPDRSTRQSRPALVVSASTLEQAHGLLLVVMSTSAANRGWADDVRIDDLTAAGLPVPSVIRSAKIATIEASDATRLGAVTPAILRSVARQLARHLNLSART